MIKEMIDLAKAVVKSVLTGSLEPLTDLLKDDMEEQKKNRDYNAERMALGLTPEEGARLMPDPDKPITSEIGNQAVTTLQNSGITGAIEAGNTAYQQTPAEQPSVGKGNVLGS